MAVRLTEAQTSWRGTPFAPRTAPLNANQLWMHWDGAMVVDTYSDLGSELRAIRSRVALGDMSPLSKYEVTGDGGVAYLDHLMPRDLTDLATGQVLYTPWCREDGMTVNDGLVARVSHDTFWISADPCLEWLTEHLDGHQVEVRDITDEIAILTVQGPKSAELMALIADGDWTELPFSRITEVTVAGYSVHILRQGFTGELGYELWVPAEAAIAVWDTVIAAGEPLGITPAGARTLDVARVEAGLLIIGYDYAGAGIDRHGATVHVDDADLATPFELGLGRLIDFDKADYIGKRALQDLARGAPLRKLTGLTLDWKALLDAFAQEGTLPADIDRVQWYPKDLAIGGEKVGRATSVTWAPSVEKMVGFAHLPAEHAPGTNLELRWSERPLDISVPAVTCELPFLELRRRTDPD